MNHTAKPSPEFTSLGFGIILTNTLPDFDENILHQVLGVFNIDTEIPNNDVDVARVVFDKFFPRIFIIGIFDFLKQCVSCVISMFQNEFFVYCK